ncbi:diguanylate cyclase [Sulfobacillus acidophilus TPY]|nr:diguanylate cyclase [Sulfobacillus acidophilus TPY]
MNEGDWRTSLHGSASRRRVQFVVLGGLVAYVAFAFVVGGSTTGGSLGPQHAAIIRTVVIELVLSTVLLAGLHYVLVYRWATPLEVQAHTDELTGWLRPGTLWEQAEALWQRALNARHPLAFVMIDLDDFKHLNDTYGHATGDRVLQALGQALRQSVRSRDRVGRMGGEEFAWVMPETTGEQAREAVDRFLQLCASLPVTDAVHGIRFSAGVAAMTGQEVEPPTVWELARRTDRALYQAKAAGKHQVVLERPAKTVALSDAAALRD